MEDLHRHYTSRNGMQSAHEAMVTQAFVQRKYATLTGSLLAMAGKSVQASSQFNSTGGSFVVKPNTIGVL